MNGLLVDVTGIDKQTEFKDFEDIARKIGAVCENDAVETFELDGLKGVGIVALEQSKLDTEYNILGIKGPFAVIGMERLEGDNDAHVFHGMTELEIIKAHYAIQKDALIKSLNRMTERNEAK